MKTFCIPLISKTFSVYHGEEDWGRFNRASIKAGAYKESLDAPCPEKGSGRAFGGWVWVRSISDTAALIHELSHVLDNLMEQLRSSDSEFRAYCTEWVIDTVLEWAKGEE